MAKECDYHPYASGDIALMVGASQTEGEINQFEWVVQTYQPRIAVIMGPAGLELDGTNWDHVYIADSAQHGDVMAGVWQIGMKNLVPINCFVGEPSNLPHLRNLRQIQAMRDHSMWGRKWNRGYA